MNITNFKSDFFNSKILRKCFNKFFFGRSDEVKVNYVISFPITSEKDAKDTNT